jgi:hypothetical protein
MMKPGSGDHPDDREAEQQAHRQKKQSLSKKSHAGLLIHVDIFLVRCKSQRRLAMSDKPERG